MTKAILRVGLGLCDELERLAPRTRPRRTNGDVTASSIALRAERLRRLLQKVDGVAQPSAADWLVATEQVEAAVNEATEWRARNNPDHDTAAAITTVEEHAAVFTKLVRSAHVADVH